MSVRSFLWRRVAWMLPTWIGITLVLFLAVRAAPGDPAVVMAGVEAGGDVPQGVDLERGAQRFRARHLLDQPLWRQYAHFLGPLSMAPDGHRLCGGSGERPWHGLLALDLGTEMHRPTVGVVGEIARRLRVTAPLALASIALSYAVAVPLGVWVCTRRGRRADGPLSLFLFGLHAVPTFWAGLMLILVFGAAGLGWLPTLGLSGRDAQRLSGLGRAVDVARHAVLPVLTLTYGSLAYLSRQMRAGLLDVLESDWMRAARAKGLSESSALWRHGVPNALLPVLTLLGAVLPALVGGSIVVESIFDLPGMGRYAYEGLLARDYNVVMATATFSALLTLVGLLLSDIAYALADPRIRHGG